MSDSDSKKLHELRVVDLRSELEKRGLDKTGVKKDLVERLQKALQNEGIDPETYTFDIGDKKTIKRLSTSSSSCQGDENAINEKNENNDDKIEETTPNKKQSKTNESEKKSKEMEQETISDENADKGTMAEKDDEEPVESFDLTLDEEEGNMEQAGTKSKKVNQESDEKTTTAKETGQVEESTATTSTTPTTSTSPQEATKKNQDADTGTSASNGASEDTSQQKKAQSNPRILWITNVPKNTRANELKQLLSSCGKVVCAKVVVNARFPGSCCFGYVTMGSAEDATNVIAKLNNTEFNGQIIKIDKFENIKADNLNPARKKTEEIKKTQPNEKKEDKSKKSPENKDKTDETEKSEDKEKEKDTSRAGSKCSPERRKSLASDRSSRGRKRTPSGERMRERDRPFHRSDSRGHRPNVLTFDKIKEERERQRMRDRERALREDSRRRHEEEMRLREMREITRRQRNEAERLEREREKLRIERDKIEREKSELLKLERERQRIEREKLEMEKMELQRSRLRLEEDRRAAKRQVPMPYRREEGLEERKRPPGDRHFEETAPRFEPPHQSEPIPSKKFAPSKDFKRLPFDKHESFSEKRGRDYNSERSHQSSSINRTNPSVKYDRSYDNTRESRDPPSRDSQTNLSMRSKDSRYVERERSPHYRSVQYVPSSQGKSDRDHHYSESNDRWNHPVPPQSKFGSNNQKSWATKGSSTWRPETQNVDRWNQGSSSSGRSLGQHFSGNSNMSPACPPPPGINNYSDRFDYNKSSSIRKY